ncbi:DNA endonuclease SmrA [Candidatus Methylospira mobilis]|uniref:DNA endonuclease SmrA n=1 Tax=Candidatus Methylospira mobilis TaxID=1808979 RepID=A0A5Q0BFD9_9GAMM|nr:DNA endonuclease SmrA [Candidatus Methylospira mobilis]QFY42583.1 DNA endonuclease SmrA [Candidatus Methylospira mobilis]WNV04303.1 DNA endonuclease SmrA [Candidatus Methylospira mobilis]
MNDEDFDLFRKEVADVNPIRPVDKVALTDKRKPVSVPGQVYRRFAAQKDRVDDNFLPSGYVDLVDPQAIISFKREGVQNGVFDKLQQGRYPVLASLDLHLMTIEVARDAVYKFIKICMRRDERTVLITHGKGVRQKEAQGVLKSCVVRWLPMMTEVMAFHSAQPFHGGSGAVYVMLRKSEEAKAKTRATLGLR